MNLVTKLGEVKGNYANGTFSNSATNNSKLKVFLQLKEFPNFNDYKVYQNHLIKQLSEEGFSQEIINYWAYRGKKSLKKLQARDKIKTKWAKASPYTLHRITYKENIEDKMNEIIEDSGL